MDFIQLIEQNSFMVWLREGGSLWGYPAILFAHTLGLGAVAGVNGVVDLRVLGFGRRIPLSSLLGMFGLAWIAFGVTLVSGLILLASDASNKLATPDLLRQDDVRDPGARVHAAGQARGGGGRRRGARRAACGRWGPSSAGWARSRLAG